MFYVGPPLLTSIGWEIENVYLEGDRRLEILKFNFFPVFFKKNYCFLVGDSFFTINFYNF